jgi:hypothetical protein
MKNVVRNLAVVTVGSVICAGTVMPAFAQSSSTTFRIDPRGTYLRISPADAAVGVPNALAINLSNLGIFPGDSIQLLQLGSFRGLGNPGPDTSRAMGGVFSTSNVLLPTNVLARVPGAIEAGVDVLTAPTNLGGLPTDIPQDFRINTDVIGTSIQIQVPTGAGFLFVSALDSQFSDNTDANGDFAVQISRSAIPTPALLPGLIGLGLGVWRKRQQKLSSTLH